MTVNNVSDLEIPSRPYPRLLVLHDMQRQSDRMTKFVFRFQQIGTRVHLGSVDDSIPHSLDIVFVDSLGIR